MLPVIDFKSAIRFWGVGFKALDRIPKSIFDIFFRDVSYLMTHGRITLKDDYVGGVYFSHEENMFFGFYDKKSHTSVV